MIQPNPELPIIDWEYTKLLNSKAAGLTEDLMQMFMRNLPTALTAINEAFAENDMMELHEHLHKLQGSCTYCGMLRLADFVAQVSRVLQQSTQIESTWLSDLNQEIELIKNELAAKGFNLFS